VFGWLSRDVFGWLGRRRAVAARAEALVRCVLSDSERAQLRRDGFLEVPSPSVEGRRYRIPRRGSPVAVLEPTGRVVYLCLQPETPVAEQELLVVHKLMLEGAEDEYWHRANRVGRAMGQRLFF
jgi:hypothetical protein